MKKHILLAITLFVFSLLLAGRTATPVYVRGVVTQVDVYTRHNGQNNHYRLTQDQDMEAVLNYLRAVDTHIPAGEIPLADPENSFTIQVTLADDSFHIYQQQADSFYRRDNVKWKCINPQHGKKLAALEKRLARNNKKFPSTSVFSAFQINF